MALEAQHRAAGAVLAEREGGPLALHFGDPSAELEAARERAGLVDRSHLGRLILTGSARATYLHRITAQATKDLRPPSGARASVLERTGKLVGALYMLAPHSERLRQQFEVRIGESQFRMLAVEMVLLLPLDQTVFAIDPNHDANLQLAPDHGLEVLHVHQEAGIAANRQNLAVR